MGQSDLNKVRDDLFLDTATDSRLDVVTSNLGLHRPSFGFSDTHWRAVGRALAAQPKNVIPTFHKILNVCVGPQYGRVATLESLHAAGVDLLTVESVDDLIQIGTAILDPGLASEEEVTVVFKDRTTNQVFLEGVTTNNHSAVQSATGFLKTGVAIGAVNLVLQDSSQFQVTTPYSIILDQGTVNEEALSVTNNNTGTNTLTVSATTKAHPGTTSLFYQAPITLAAPAGRDFLNFADTKTRSFPATGWVRINAGGVNEEVLEYTGNNVTDSTLTLKKVLVSAHVAGETVDLVNPGATVKSCSIWQPGKFWEIFEPEPKKVYVYIPKDLEPLRIIDASYLHDITQAAVATTLANPTLTTDTDIVLTSVVGLPDEAGILLIDGVQKVFYKTRDELTNTVTLSDPIGVAYLAGVTADLVTVPYVGTDLEEGNPRDAAGVVLEDRFPGPYVYDPGTPGPGIPQTTLFTLITPPTRLASAQVLNRTNIEVLDASLWVGAPLDILIGAGSGFEETRTVTDITLKGISTTVATNPDTLTLTVPAGGSLPFPEGDGVHPDGYRIIIDRGGANEEIAVVSLNDSGADTITLLNALTIVHLAGETIELLNDVLTVDALIYNHAGPTVNPSKEGVLVQPYISQITLVSGADFTTTGGSAILNFGNSVVKASSKFVSTLGLSLVLASTDKFPTTGFPYQVVVGEGTYVEERVTVTANNTGIDTLTLSSALVNTHVLNENITFTPGVPEVVTYSSRSGNTLLFNTSQILESYHAVGESVILSTNNSEPLANGFSYSLKLPPDPGACAKVLLELARAAGIQVIMIDEK